MATRGQQADALRRQLDKALEKGRTKEALAALAELEGLEPKEPRWPQRLGDVLRRAGRTADAEEAYLRAMHLYSAQGFLPQAVALAKVVVALNPARSAILDQINQQAARDLRRTLSGARRGASAGSAPPLAAAALAPAASPRAVPGPQAAAGARSPIALGPAPAPAPAAPARQRFLPRAAPRPAPAPAAPAPVVESVEASPASMEVDLGALDTPSVEVEFGSLGPEVVEIDPPSSEPPRRAVPPPVGRPPAAVERPRERSRWGATVEKHNSFIGGIPLEGMLAAARALEPAEDEENDEVRFSDVPEEECVDVAPSELDGMRVPGTEAEVGEEDSEALDAERLVALSGAALLADVSPEALGALARAAELVELQPGEHVFREGEEADALYVIVQGAVLVLQRGVAGGAIELAQGQIFGEVALLQGGRRQADVRARTPALLLRIGKAELGEIVVEYREVHQLLFDLLVQRLVANVLQTSFLFSAFDLDQRKDLATMFEVRWAAPEVVLQEAGKRSDGLYLLLVGEFVEVVGGELVPLPLGTVIGHRSLLSHGVATRTIMTLTESVVLRMPAKRFGSFAVQFPPALAELATRAVDPEDG